MIDGRIRETRIQFRGCDGFRNVDHAIDVLIRVLAGGDRLLDLGTGHRFGGSLLVAHRRRLLADTPLQIVIAGRVTFLRRFTIFRLSIVDFLIVARVIS